MVLPEEAGEETAQNMQHNHDRRVVGVRRVPVERIVDVCASAAPASAFQGRSVDVSGRGMQLRSGHVPELHAPVVLRFHEQGSEVIAEGEVAWRNAAAGGGEFGVRFTALDSRSVQSLKALCRADAEQAAFASAGEEPEASDHDTEPAPAVALGVKLHIAGMAAPMHAQVKEQGRRHLEVGSQLEFLRVGRSLEVEDTALGQRREAQIDRVDVTVDDESRVPELIVSVRYADVLDTPLPAPSRPRRPVPAPTDRVELNRPRVEFAEPSLRSTHAAAYAFEDPECALEPPRLADEPPAELAMEPGDEHGFGDHSGPRDFDAEDPFEGDRLRERMDGVLSQLSSITREASRQCLRFGGIASRSASALVSRARRASQTVASARQPAQRRRTTAPARTAVRPIVARQNPRSMNGAARAADAGMPALRRRGPRWVALGCLLAVATLTGVFLGRGTPTAPSGAADSVKSAPVVVPASSAPAGVSVAVAAGPSQPARTEGESESSEAPSGAVAQVPLFGPTSLDDEDSSEEAPATERALARTKVADQAFEDSARSKARPKVDVSTEFGHGRLHLPIVYRLRLDQPGASLRGERTPTGFDVIIPGRKTMESGKAISSRDDRIAKVRTQNGADGTRVSFRFRGSIPPYKVRLRKDFVEFFISSP